MATKEQQEYSADDIQNLSFPDSVRSKPGMYIGTTDEEGVFAILREALDNAVDEALAGRATTCNLHIEDDTYYIWDDGTGIPKGTTTYRDAKGKEQKVETLRAICSMLHTSGKFKDTAYKTSRGTHGIGIKATNALSTSFEVFTYFKGKWSSIEYSRGLEKSIHIDTAKAPEHPTTGKLLAKGTLIRFRPDAKIFKPCKVKMPQVSEWASIAAYFTPNFTVNVSVTKGTESREKSFHFPEGPTAFIKSRMTKLSATPINEKAPAFAAGNTLVDCVAQFTAYDGVDANPFTNGLRNSDGGVHMNAFFKSLWASLEDVRKRNHTFSVHELKDGVIVLINAKLSHPAFSSQTKDKLVDSRADAPIEEFLTRELKKFFKDNKALAEQLCERAQSLKGLKEDFLNSKKARAAIKKAGARGFHPRALVAAEAKPHERELYIVEGDSALGGCSTARQWWQEVLPLKGKITNSLRKPDDALNNDQVINILAHLGYKPDSKSPYDELRVCKVIVMADPDPDGPLIGSTKLPIKRKGSEEWEEVEIQALASSEFRNVEYSVMSFNGQKAIEAQAHSARATDFSPEQIEIRTTSGAHSICHPNHVWAVRKTGYDTRLVQQIHGGLWSLQSKMLKSGDRLLRHDGKNFVEDTVVKVKRSTLKEPVAYYCLTVPGFSTFVLSNGLLSKNCHIGSLVLTLFKQMLPGLFERGMVYVTQVPEFFALRKDEMLQGATPLELTREMESQGWPKTAIQHVKGYGEVQPSFLKRIAFDPKSRLLKQITRITEVDGDSEFRKIMGEGAEGRRILLGI